MPHHPLLRTTSSTTTTTTTTGSIISNSTSFIIDPSSATDHRRPLVGTPSATGFSRRFSRTRVGIGISLFINSILNVISIPTIIPSCRWLSLPAHLSLKPSPGRKVTGTLFGNRRGHVSFAVQYDPRSEPVLVVELAVTTAALVKEMSSGLVRIALECEKHHHRRRRGGGGQGRMYVEPRFATGTDGGGTTKLFHEPTWSMYCNGRRCGYAYSRACSGSDWHVLSTVQSVSVGAGVIPVVEDSGKRNGEGELLYMRARFERVVGSRDSEAFYMMNPDGNGGPELSIFLLRI